MKPKFTDQHKYPHGYRSAVNTNLQETFARIERERKAKEKANAEEAAQKVQPLKRTAHG